MTRLLLKSALIVSAATLLIAAGPRADLNQDGQVTKAEFMDTAQTHFLAVDANADGFLSEEERKAFRAAKVEEMKSERFSRLDADGDGAITRAEMEAVGEKMKARRDEHKAKIMERFDTNLDGELSDAERTVMKAERDARDEERGEGRKARGEGKRAEGRRGEGPHGMRGKRGKRPNPDANGDGVVSLDEHLTVSEQLFARLDANADGVLTKGEGGKRRGMRGGKRGG